MKTLPILSVLCGVAFIGAASAADITIYYSPTCPHCHHARTFISNNLVYEYPQLKVTEVSVVKNSNVQMFRDALKKCEYESGGVPVLVVGDKCFQGYAEFMNKEIRDAVEVDLDDAAKKLAAENQKAMESDADAFRESHAGAKGTVSEYASEASLDDQKKNEIATPDNTVAKKGGSTIWFYGLLIVLVAALGFVLVGNGAKKK